MLFKVKKSHAFSFLSTPQAPKKLSRKKGRLNVIIVDMRLTKNCPAPFLRLAGK
jgi:hypothetical protein